jgi:hypothetical protein
MVENWIPTPGVVKREQTIPSPQMQIKPGPGKAWSQNEVPKEMYR